MKKMYKKSSIGLLILMLIAAALSIYFRPLPLSNLLFTDNTIIVSKTVIETKEGIPNIDSQVDEDITEQQKKEILELFNQYSYMRKINTLFSDGSFSGNGDATYLYMYIYDGTMLKNTVSFTDGGEISVNNKNYKLKNSNDIINEIQVILGK